MSRTISQLDYGESVFLKESGEDAEYIVIRKDIHGCVLLRALAVTAKRMHSSNVSVYDGCEMDNYLCDEETGFLSKFDTATLNALQSRSISTYEYGDTACHYISRKCYLLSYGDMLETASTELEPDANVVPQLMIFNQTIDANTARKCLNGTSSVGWWLRSPYSATGFYYVSSDGASGSYSASSAYVSFRPALNVSPDTIVSDVGADIIYLLPQQGFRTVEFSGLVLTSVSKPIKALVSYNAVNLYDVSVLVCNNYGDTVPVWVAATNQQEVELINSSKTTDTWQVGIKCFGKSNGYGYFDEPIIKMEVE